MSAIRILGTVVSTDVFSGTSKKTQKPFVIHTCYVVNGGGRPESLKIMADENPYKAGSKVDLQVTAQVFNGEINYYPVRA